MKHKNSTNNDGIFRNHTAESKLFLRRVLVCLLFIIIFIGILLSNLYYLQITNHEFYKTETDKNRIKLQYIAPTRGLIYDRNGLPIAKHKNIWQLEIQPDNIKDLEATITELKKLINITEEDINNFKEERKIATRYSFIPLKSNLDEDEIARFSNDRHKFYSKDYSQPTVIIKNYQRRYYPYGESLAHILGYVAKISAKDVERLKAEDKFNNYKGSSQIGRAGIENIYEDILHGTTGTEEVEVNNRGKVIRQLSKTPPKAGQDIYLTIDLKLQLHIQELLSHINGAIIVSDPKSGEILALFSSPSYDPNLFVDGISVTNYKNLNDNPNRPLFNRATKGLYPPASTVKPFIGLAALAEGTISPTTSIYDPGWWQLPNSEKKYRDWKRWGHGQLNIEKSIIESADTFFYQLSYDMGIDKMHDWMVKFGYGRPTGIDIDETTATVMPSREWKENNRGAKWLTGDTIPVGIGQGYWSATPIQMAKVLNTLINEGAVKTPHLFLRSQQHNEKHNYLQVEKSELENIDKSYWELIKKSMYGVAHASNGTAKNYFSDAQYQVALKTGTAQVHSYEVDLNKDKAKRLRDHRMMIGFGPYDDPKISVVIVLENAGKGSLNGEMMRSIMDYHLLGEKYIPESLIEYRKEAIREAEKLRVLEEKLRIEKEKAAEEQRLKEIESQVN
ncbi:penicillin-binding protein 2 [Thorsellia kenyensis]|uniref:Peptidoglycan D,D-transpeptidase MrdA n=1 Tax=Thorsellia kenyensis TaxID=1549888 RepID=A0ABV6C7Y2_9GAMM